MKGVKASRFGDELGDEQIQVPPHAAAPLYAHYIRHTHAAQAGQDHEHPLHDAPGCPKALRNQSIHTGIDKAQRRGG